MATRPIVIDVESLTTRQPGDACPACAASMAWARYGHGTPIRQQVFRCSRGRQPKVFEVRCRACGQLVIMYEVGQRTAVVPGDQAELRRWIREQERDALASDD